MTGHTLTYDAATVPDSPSLPIARNTAAPAANTAMLQLSAAVASITLVLVLGTDGLLGLGPAIVLAAGALAAIPAGRSMDRFGRVPVLPALGSAQASAPAVLAGLGGVGISNGATLLARTAGGDMYPPVRRARGIALVLFGTIFGAILGPVVFGPVLAGRELDGDSLTALWLAAGAFELVGLALVAAVRPDPKRIGDLADRIGRTRALAGGLIVMGLSVSGLLWVEGAPLAVGAVVLVTVPAVWVLRGGPRWDASQFGNDHPRRQPCTCTRDCLNPETTR
jgi:MFS family permease